MVGEHVSPSRTHFFFYVDVPKCTFTFPIGKPKKELHKDMPEGKYLPFRITAQLAEG